MMMMMMTMMIIIIIIITTENTVPYNKLDIIVEDKKGIYLPASISDKRCTGGRT
jgi:membrane-associated HD superfamily phosphohydrolase